MSPSDVLRQARASSIRLRQIEDELETLRSRIGGQGTGFGTSIDHNVILDGTRQVDDLIIAENEYAYEIACCRESIGEAERLIAGAEPKIVEDCIANGSDPMEAVMNANDMCYALRLYYVEAADFRRMQEMTGCDKRVNTAMLRMSTDLLDRIGTAHLKAEAIYDDRTPEELRRDYGQAL